MYYEYTRYSYKINMFISLRNISSLYVHFVQGNLLILLSKLSFVKNTEHCEIRKINLIVIKPVCSWSVIGLLFSGRDFFLIKGLYIKQTKVMSFNRNTFMSCNVLTNKLQTFQCYVSRLLNHSIQSEIPLPFDDFLHLAVVVERQSACHKQNSRFSCGDATAHFPRFMAIRFYFLSKTLI